MDLLLSPPILFFVLGVFAIVVRSDLDIPKPVVRLLSIYLLISIGMLGGYKISLGGIDKQASLVMGVSIFASFAMPFATYWVLRLRLSSVDSAAVAATFGSISAVTFITAIAFLDSKDIAYSGYMVASMALMESPAIVSAVLLSRMVQAGRKQENNEQEGPRVAGNASAVWREALFNGPVILLVGSMLIGAVCGQRGWEKVAPFMEAPFQGVLCLFLLDMGLIAARRIVELRSAGVFLVTFGIVGAVVQGLIGIGAAWAIGVGPGDALLIAVLFGSASYIAVPAAMRLVLPKANPSIYVTVALTITFPFNIVLGIPMYNLLIRAIGIGA